MKRLLKFTFLLLVIVAAWLAWALLLPVRLNQPIFVILKPGWSTRHIATELKEQGVIRNAQAFLLYHYVVKPKTLKAGEYKFENSSSAMVAHDRLVRGDIYVHYVTVPEGFNMFDIGDAIEAEGLGKREEFVDQAKKQTLLIKDLDPEATSLEGYLFPDTYGFSRAQTMSDIVGVMVRRFKQEANALNLKSDVHRVVTLASIV